MDKKHATDKPERILPITPEGGLASIVPSLAGDNLMKEKPILDMPDKLEPQEPYSPQSTYYVPEILESSQKLGPAWSELVSHVSEQKPASLFPLNKGKWADVGTPSDLKNPTPPVIGE